METSTGKIITFYSYKGGTGRTMALANIACALSLSDQQRDKKPILMIDWDLEAPGLHRFFRNYLKDGHLRDQRAEQVDLVRQPGLIDLFSEIDLLSQQPNETAEDEEATRELVASVKLSRYVVQTSIPGLRLITAGRFDKSYAGRVNTFQWEALYRRAPNLVRAFAERLEAEFRYVLIDSRTGLSDTSGICTMLMPTILVAVFTPNLQSLEGTIELVRRATDYRRESNDLRPLTVFPIASRIDVSEEKLREQWRFGKKGDIGYQDHFERLFSDAYGLGECDLTPYFDDTIIPHVPYFAYGEELAVLSARMGDKFSLKRSYTSLAHRLTSQEVPWEVFTPAEGFDIVEFKPEPTIENQSADIGLTTVGKILSLASFLASPRRILNVTLGATFLGAMIVVSLLVAQLLKQPGTDRRGYIYSIAAAVVVGVAALFWLVLGSRRSHPIESIGALRGLLPYSEADGKIFSQLGRDMEVRSCLNYLEDSKNAVVVIHGQSGAGKTSLLRAGIKHQVHARQPEVPCIYWAAVKEDAAAALAEEIKAATGLDCKGDPENLLLIATGRMVLILDQLERLDRRNPQHRTIFKLIHEVSRQSPPHVLQLIVAFKSDYLGEWLTFQDDTALQSVKVPLGFFTIERAVEVMGIILDDQRIDVKPEIIDSYIRDVAENDLVSPVSIALGALAFLRWNQESPGKGIPPHDFARAGGTLAVLRAHVGQIFDQAGVTAEDRPRLVKGLTSTLVDVNNDRVNPQGASPEAIAEASFLPPQRVRSYLNDLRAGRILEFVPQTNSYLLAHDRLIPVLKELALDITLIENEILHQYLLWRRKEQIRFLLRGRKLRWALTTGRFIAGADTLARVRYLNLSVRARWASRFAYVAAAALLAIVALTIYRVLKVSTYVAELKQAHLPAELYEHQEQLQALSFNAGTLTNLNWLHSSTLADLSISSQVGSLKGLGALNGLRSLELDLANVDPDSLQQISNLQALRSLTLHHIRPQKQLFPDFSNLRDLRGLALDFEDSQIAFLPDLDGAQNLENLTLNLRSTRVSDLSGLERLARLRSVSVFLNGSPVTTLLPLARLEHLEALALSLDQTQLHLLWDLKGIQNPLSLTLYLGTSGFADFPDLEAIPQLRSLTVSIPGANRGRPFDLTRMRQLRELTLNLPGSDVEVLPDFVELTRLRSLELGLDSTAVRRLPDLSPLHDLERLTLNLDNTAIRELPDLGRLEKLNELNLFMRDSRIHVLHIRDLSELQALSLDISGTDIADLNSIVHLPKLAKLVLYLRWSQMRDLPDLSPLNGLRVLELHLEGAWDVQELPDLRRLTGLTELALFLDGSQTTRLPDLSRLPRLRKITLSLRRSQIEDLSSLAHIGSLEDLALDLEGARIQSLPDLTDLKYLRRVALDIRGARMNNLDQTRRLSQLRELTIDYGFPSLKGLPATVTRLQIGLTPQTEHVSRRTAE